MAHDFVIDGVLKNATHLRSSDDEGWIMIVQAVCLN
jgi:hypothetical protein